MSSHLSPFLLDIYNTIEYNRIHEELVGRYYQPNKINTMHNKPVKVTINGRRQSDIDLHRTTWERFKIKTKRLLHRLTIFSLSLLGIWIACIIYANLNPAIIYTKAEVIKEVESKAPVLDRIMGCESQGNAKLKGTHYDKNGQVLMRSNINKTVDIGISQINTVWFKKATELGYDLTKEEDNKLMALWIYKNRGTGDWSASKSCWQ